MATAGSTPAAAAPVQSVTTTATAHANRCCDVDVGRILLNLRGELHMLHARHQAASQAWADAMNRESTAYSTLLSMLDIAMSSLPQYVAAGGYRPPPGEHHGHEPLPSSGAPAPVAAGAHDDAAATGLAAAAAAPAQKETRARTPAKPAAPTATTSAPAAAAATATTRSAHGAASDADQAHATDQGPTGQDPATAAPVAAAVALPAAQPAASEARPAATPAACEARSAAPATNATAVVPPAAVIDADEQPLVTGASRKRARTDEERAARKAAKKEKKERARSDEERRAARIASAQDID